MKTITIAIDENVEEIIKEASEQLQVSQSAFISQAVKFAATANVLFYEHPMAQVSILGPMKTPSLNKLEYYHWCPMWSPKDIYYGPRNEKLDKWLPFKSYFDLREKVLETQAEEILNSVAEASEQKTND